MLEKGKKIGCNTTAKILKINKSTVIRWKKTLRSLAEKSLKPGYGMQTKGIKRRKNTLQFCNWRKNIRLIIMLLTKSFKIRILPMVEYWVL